MNSKTISHKTEEDALSDSQAKSNLNWYVLGQGLSLLGNFLQSAAVSLLIMDLVPKHEAANWVSGYSTLVLAPSVLLAPFAGLALDFWCKKKVLIWASVFGVIYSLVLACFVQTNRATITVIVSVALVAGLVNAFDGPGRTAIVKDITNKFNEDHGSRLVIMIVNLGQIIAPSLAGYLVLHAGYTWTFVLNAISFVALMVAFLKVRMRPRVISKEVISRKMLFQRLADSVRYTYSNKALRMCTVLMAIMTGLGYSYSAVLSIIARDMYHGSALVPVIYGKLGTCLGIGSLAAALVTVKVAPRFKPTTIILFGGALTGIGLVCFSYSVQLWSGCVAVLGVGFGLVLLVSTFRTITNKVTERAMIGAVSGINVACFYGAIGGGMLVAGMCTTLFGCQVYLFGCGAAMLTVTTLLPMLPHLQVLNSKEGAKLS